MRGTAIGLAVFCIVINVIAQMLLKSGMHGLDASSGVLSLLTNGLMRPKIWMGLAVYVLSTLIWLIVLARLPLSLAYPMTSLGIVLTWLAGAFLLNELIDWKDIIAMLFICAGLLLLTRGI